jgi:DNA invertase Pin-like site-specific DNA recombinase
MSNLNHQPRYVSYFRVSTKKQGQSGLGLEAQKLAVKEFLNQSGGEIIAEFIEVESGKRSDRPEFSKAADYAELANGILLVAKLDRLSRDLHFITGLQKRGIKFKLCDLPEVDQLTVHVLAAMAQHEAKMISHRTTQAMKMAKARGTILGNPNLDTYRNQSVVAANEQRISKQETWKRKILKVIQHIQIEENIATCKDISAALNQRGLTTYRGKHFSISIVSNLLRSESLS